MKVKVPSKVLEFLSKTPNVLILLHENEPASVDTPAFWLLDY